MTYRIRYWIVEVLRTSRRALLPVIIALATLYFGLYAIYGPKGFQILSDREDAQALAAAELGLLEEERQALERRVRLLAGRAVDPDLLEEEARRVLNRAHPDEVIVLMQPLDASNTGPASPPGENQQ